MVRTLRLFCVLVLVSIGIVTALCVAQQMQGAPEIEQNPRPSILERFKQADKRSERITEGALSPLVRQAESFALYLHSEPPESDETSELTVDVMQEISEPEPKRLKPKFKVIGTMYNRSKPEKSMALVSVPGKKPHWVKRGARLGHFIVEKIERGLIVYNDGDRSCKMAVDMKDPDQIAHTRRATLVSSQTEMPQQGAAGPNEPVNKP
ncbi:MAG: hypothetical protein PVH77_05450 [Phycisphaerales bacterium]|jgi:hypothetical protein